MKTADQLFSSLRELGVDSAAANQAIFRYINIHFGHGNWNIVTDRFTEEECKIITQEAIAPKNSESKTELRGKIALAALSLALDFEPGGKATPASLVDKSVVVGYNQALLDLSDAIFELF